jgi:RHS repeat-associated protein
VTDNDGNVVQSIAYIPYGEVFIEERNGTWNTPYLFNGKELDEETGLYYYGARYLNPTSGMWLSVDPMWEDYKGVSPYAYCLGNPVKHIDVEGEWVNVAIGAAVGFVLGAAIASYNGENVISSALSGAVNGALVASGATLLTTVAVNVAFSAAEQGVRKGKVDVTELAAVGVTSVLSSGAGKASKLCTEYVGKKLILASAKTKGVTTSSKEIKRVVTQQYQQQGKKIGPATKKQINKDVAKIKKDAMDLYNTDRNIIENITYSKKSQYVQEMTQNFVFSATVEDAKKILKTMD